MKKILFIYPFMMLGGSTTSLLALLNNIDSKKYKIYLQLQKNEGQLFNDIPNHVTILSEAQKRKGKLGKIIRILHFIFSGYALKAFLTNRKYGKKGLSKEVINYFLAKKSCKKNKEIYDYAVSFLEGWSSWYLAYNVCAEKKYAWQHSTFSKITDTPQEQISWMNKVNKIVFVDDACTREFNNILPDMKNKSMTIKNIIDSNIIRAKAECYNEKDCYLQKFKEKTVIKVITVCRLTIETKGLDRIVNCSKELIDRGFDFLWYIVGDGADEVRLKKMIEEKNVGDFLIPIGARFNPYPFIKEADIMCMPSRYEGKPMVVTESMILGVPPVVTEYLSARTQIENGVNGIVVDNNEKSIIATMVDLVSNKKKIIELKNQLKLNDFGNKDYIKEIEQKLF